MSIKPRESLPYSLGRLTQSAKRILDPVVRSIRFGLRGKSGRAAPGEAWQQRLRQHVPVFVYQMGKVASTSVYESLRSQYSGHVFHGHYFSANHGNAELRALYDYCNQTSPAIKVISLVREPISRNISAFFQNFKRDTGKSIEQCGQSMLELRDTFLKNYPHEIPWVWFDNNIKRHFGIDVYEHTFPTEGHLRLSDGSTELLLMRHDLADQQKASLVGEFVGLDGFSVARANVSSDKEYSQYMTAFQELRLPKWYLYRVFSSKYSKHFYGDEIGELMRRWQESDEQAA